MIHKIDKLKNLLIALAKNEGWELHGVLQLWQQKVEKWIISTNIAPINNSKPAQKYTFWFNEINNKTNVISFNIESNKPRILLATNNSQIEVEINMNQITGMWKLRKYFQESLTKTSKLEIN